MEADIASQAVGLGTNTDFTLLSLFLRADIVVKSVIIILIVCSIYSWAVIIEKFRLFRKINKLLFTSNYLCFNGSDISATFVKPEPDNKPIISSTLP